MVQLFKRQCRLQINNQFQFTSFQLFSDITARAEHQRSAHSIMRKQHLTKIFIQLFLSIIYRCSHIPKRQPLKFFYVGFFKLQRDKRRHNISNLMSCFFCKTISVSRRSGRLIRKSTCRNNTCVSRNLFPILRFQVFKSALADNPFHFCMQMNRNAKLM